LDYPLPDGQHAQGAHFPSEFLAIHPPYRIRFKRARAQILSPPLKVLLQVLVKDGHGPPITSCGHTPLVLSDLVRRAPKPGDITPIAVELRTTMMRVPCRLPPQFSLLFADLHGYALSHHGIKADSQRLMSESPSKLRSLALSVMLSRAVDGA
jgi:hypothetical protein